MNNTNTVTIACRVTQNNKFNNKRTFHMNKEEQKTTADLNQRIYLKIGNYKKLSFEQKNYLKDQGLHFDKYHEAYFLDDRNNIPPIFKDFPEIPLEQITKTYRQYIEVPYNDVMNIEKKALLKQNGAKFDKDANYWYYMKIQGTNNPAFKEYREIPLKEVLDNIKELAEKNKNLKELSKIAYERELNIDPNTEEKLGLSIPEARFDVSLRYKIKELGCFWDKDNNTWAIIKKKDEPLPELLQNYATVPLKPKNKTLANFDKIKVYLLINEAHPAIPNNEDLRRKLKSHGAYWDSEHKSWVVELVKNQKLPKFLEQFPHSYRPFNNINKVNNKAKPVSTVKAIRY